MILGAIAGVLALVVPYVVFGLSLSTSVSVSTEYNSTEGRFYGHSTHTGTIAVSGQAGATGVLKGYLYVNRPATGANDDDINETTITVPQFGQSATKTVYCSANVLGPPPSPSDSYRYYANTTLNASGDGETASNSTEVSGEVDG